MTSPVSLTGLRCEYHVNPLGLDELHPRLSWRLEGADGRRGVRQAAYQIIVASSPSELASGTGATGWATGRVESDRSIQIVYDGPALRSGQRCWWKVRAWIAGESAPTDWSEPAWWEMGLLDCKEWAPARWIASKIIGGVRTTSPAPYLRAEFELPEEVVSARLYVTALGLYEFHLNGQRVGKDVFRPGWTDYGKRLQYDVYDVTTLLRPGAPNAAGAILGDGWYAGHVAWGSRQRYGERPQLLALLRVTLADGTTRTVATGENWKTATGPILESDLLMGESYDARLEFAGGPDAWSLPGFDAAGWNAVTVGEEPAVRLVPSPGPPVRRMMELPELARKFGGGGKGPDGTVDMGQNMVGWVRIKVRAARKVTIRLRYAEILDAKGRIYTENLRGARATDYYTCAGTGEWETWEPRFTFHGFRHVELVGDGAFELAPEGITGIVVHSDTPPTGEFECSDPLLNQLQHNIQWGQRGNFFEVPTDCPQRDERLGWTGDAQVFIRTAAFNMDVAAFFTKWQDDIDDAQGKAGDIPSVVPSILDTDGGPAWADAAVICPWTVHLCYGDTRLLETHYGSFVRFVQYLADTGRDGGIRCYEGAEYRRGYGDWLALDGSGKTEGGTPKELIGTAFHSYSARLLGRIARVLGKEDAAAGYERQADEVRAAFCREFVTAGGRITGGTQTSYVLALHFDLLPEELRPAAAKFLVEDIRARGNHLSTGFVGTPYLPHVLTRAGYLDVAYELLHQKTWPSWLYAVTQGATTIWERWNGWTHDQGFADAGMNSYNHYAYGAIGDWLYSNVAGLDLDPARPGYKHVVIHPRPGGGLTHAKASLQSVHGLIESGWRQEDGGRFVLEVTVPPNTTATVRVPAVSPGDVREGEKALDEIDGLIEAPRTEEGAVTVGVGSGSYRFVSTLP